MITIAKTGNCNSNNNGIVEEACEEGGHRLTNSESDRRLLRLQYHSLKTLIGDNITRVDSDKFESIIRQVEALHNSVQKPREQVADAEALLELIQTLLNCVRSHNSEGITPSDFVTCLLKEFGQQSGPSISTEESGNALVWKDIGVASSHVFKKCSGCCTMIGPMNTELKQRKTYVRGKRVRPIDSAQPEEFHDAEERTDTDQNMLTMFNILKKNRSVRLENLVLNRNSFAQTVENLFALSFLVKDGRAEVKVDEKERHIVSPRNAPSASSVVSGDVAYNHFVFRLDFDDWKLMKCSVEVGEELMPQRNEVNISSNSEVDPPSGESQASVVEDSPETEQSPVVEDSPHCDHIEERSAAIRKKRRR
ncbi:non-structural maintenance of chromosomes element 4 homolog A-like [Fagus crenata]